MYNETAVFHEMRNRLRSGKRIFLLTLGFESGLGVLALFLGYLFAEPATHTLTWSLKGLAYGFLATLPLLGLFLLFFRWPIGPLAAIRRFLDEIVYPLFSKLSTLELALISLAAGLGEELLFRGVVQNLLGQWLGVHAGWLIASLIFGLGHFITLAYALLTAIIGLFLGWLWMATGNLLAPVVAHALYDFVALYLFIKVFPPKITQENNP